jgi:hypothetical protein
VPPLAGSILRRVRWWELAPEILLIAGLTLFAVTEPHAAAAGLKSGHAVVLMLVVAVIWVAVRVAMFTSDRLRIPRLALFLFGALAILKVVVLPAYDNQTVIESPIPAAAQPTRLRSGSLAGIDHRATGTVNVYRQGSGQLVIGLEGFDIQPGPAYVLYLVPGADRQDLDGGTRIESLRGNRGTQFYDAPASADIDSGEYTVLVWCETFDVPVANATPVP